MAGKRCPRRHGRVPQDALLQQGKADLARGRRERTPQEVDALQRVQPGAHAVQAQGLDAPSADRVDDLLDLLELASLEKRLQLRHDMRPQLGEDSAQPRRGVDLRQRRMGLEEVQAVHQPPQASLCLLGLWDRFLSAAERELHLVPVEVAPQPVLQGLVCMVAVVAVGLRQPTGKPDRPAGGFLVPAAESVPKEALDVRAALPERSSAALGLQMVGRRVPEFVDGSSQGPAVPRVFRCERREAAQQLLRARQGVRPCARLGIRLGLVPKAEGP
mmetsp:Transcript_100745/g.310600  ORF Transcript_100745/g.310600 Transcript_100745/m.310600 type:complete len:273 (-) Transcript_100745:409-1227(-)